MIICKIISGISIFMFLATPTSSSDESGSKESFSDESGSDEVSGESDELLNNPPHVEPRKTFRISKTTTIPKTINGKWSNDVTTPATVQFNDFLKLLDLRSPKIKTMKLNTTKNNIKQTTSEPKSINNAKYEMVEEPQIKHNISASNKTHSTSKPGGIDLKYNTPQTSTTGHDIDTQSSIDDNAVSETHQFTSKHTVDSVSGLESIGNFNSSIHHSQSAQISYQPSTTGNRTAHKPISVPNITQTYFTTRPNSPTTTVKSVHFTNVLETSTGQFKTHLKTKPKSSTTVRNSGTTDFTGSPLSTRTGTTITSHSVSDLTPNRIPPKTRQSAAVIGNSPSFPTDSIIIRNSSTHPTTKPTLSAILKVTHRQSLPVTRTFPDITKDSTIKPHSIFHLTTKLSSSANVKVIFHNPTIYDTITTHTTSQPSTEAYPSSTIQVTGRKSTANRITSKTVQVIRRKSKAITETGSTSSTDSAITPHSINVSILFPYSTTNPNPYTIVQVTRRLPTAVIQTTSNPTKDSTIAPHSANGLQTKLGTSTSVVHAIVSESPSSTSGRAITQDSTTHTTAYDTDKLKHIDGYTPLSTTAQIPAKNGNSTTAHTNCSSIKGTHVTTLGTPGYTDISTKEIEGVECKIASCSGNEECEQQIEKYMKCIFLKPVKSGTSAVEVYVLLWMICLFFFWKY